MHMTESTKLTKNDKANENSSGTRGTSEENKSKSDPHSKNQLSPPKQKRPFLYVPTDYSIRPRKPLQKAAHKYKGPRSESRQSNLNPKRQIGIVTIVANFPGKPRIKIHNVKLLELDINFKLPSVEKVTVKLPSKSQTLVIRETQKSEKREKRHPNEPMPNNGYPVYPMGFDPSMYYVQPIFPNPGIKDGYQDYTGLTHYQQIPPPPLPLSTAYPFYYSIPPPFGHYMSNYATDFSDTRTDSPIDLPRTPVSVDAEVPHPEYPLYPMYH